MDNQAFVAIFVVLGYLLGAVPFGVVLSNAMGLPDPRTVGSKNVGFTNVLRLSGKIAGILTLIGDMGKGWVMSFMANISRAEIATREDQKAVLDFIVEVSDTRHLQQVLKAVERVDGVITARRLRAWQERS